MISKIILYIKACHKGEILKRIEYKLKDMIGFFYIRNKATKVNKNYKLQIAKIKKISNQEKNNDSYYIFGKKYSYDKIKESLYSDNIFWRKNNISSFDDIKIIWEHNRLQFLPSIAIKYQNTNNKKYKKLIIDVLDYWVEKNKYEYSINWTNNLEVAIRSISIFMTLLILNDKSLNKKYSQILYLHGKYLYNEINYSKVCIPNNHLIGEAVALLVLSNIIDDQASFKWEKRATSILNKHCDIINDDGTSFENSFSYQFFVTKMFILALCYIKDDSLYNRLNKKVLASLKLLRLTIYKNNVINYGDNDDGTYFTVFNKYNLKDDIIRYYNLFYNLKLDSETNILNELLNINKNIEYGVLDDTNYFINKNMFLYRWEDNLIFFNAKDIAGHAHNDSLHLELVINNESVLPDLGTYSYNLDKKKRKFYVSRNAHNTILSNKQNAIHVGTFRWQNNDNSYLEDILINEKQVIAVGAIENVCRRKIKIDKIKKTIEIVDETLDEQYLIKTNFNVLDSKLNGNIISNKNCDIILDDNEIETKKSSISKRYLEEKIIFNYQTLESKSHTTKIVFK